MQKRILKTMLNMKYKESCRDTSKNHKMLTVYAIYIYVCVTFLMDNMSKCKNDKYKHSCGTRNKSKFVVPNHILKNTEKGPYYAAIKFYTYLSLPVREGYRRSFLRNV